MIIVGNRFVIGSQIMYEGYKRLNNIVIRLKLKRIRTYCSFASCMECDKQIVVLIIAVEIVTEVKKDVQNMKVNAKLM